MKGERGIEGGIGDRLTKACRILRACNSSISPQEGSAIKSMVFEFKLITVNQGCLLRIMRSKEFKGCYIAHKASLPINEPQLNGGGLRTTTSRNLRGHKRAGRVGMGLPAHLQHRST